MKNNTPHGNRFAFSTIEPLEERIAPANLPIPVTNTNPSGAGSLLAAIMQADTQPGNDTIVFHLTTPALNVIMLGGELLIDPATKGDHLTITGPGSNKIIIDGNGHRIFDIDDGVGGTDSPVTITGLALIHGNGTGANNSGNGGAIFSTESLTLKNCTISGNTASNAGGVNVQANGAAGTTVTVTNCLVSGNSATGGGYGGGLALVASKSVVVTGCTIIGNSATYEGGGVYARSEGNGTAVTISHNLIAGNTATNYGGGLFVADTNINPLTPSKVVISSNTISGNSATNDPSVSGGPSLGGGIFTGLANVVLTGDNIRANTAVTGGGGIEATDANSLTITGGSITGNGVSKGAGGGLSINHGSASADPVTISGAHITDNHASSNGGGIYLNDAGVVKLTGDFIDGNTSGGTKGGGGLFDHASTSTSITGGEISNNLSSSSDGGGFYIYGGATVVMHSTHITGNFCDGAGGGGYLDVTGAQASITAIGLIVAGNQSEGDGGGLELGGVGTLTMQGGVISGNNTNANGGGIYMVAGDGLTGTITGTHITGNAAAGDGGGIDKQTGVLPFGTGELALVTGNVALNDPNVDGI